MVGKVSVRYHCYQAKMLLYLRRRRRSGDMMVKEIFIVEYQVILLDDDTMMILLMLDLRRPLYIHNDVGKNICLFSYFVLLLV